MTNLRYIQVWLLFIALYLAIARKSQWASSKRPPGLDGTGTAAKEMTKRYGKLCGQDWMRAETGVRNECKPEREGILWDVGGTGWTKGWDEAAMRDDEPEMRCDRMRLEK